VADGSGGREMVVSAVPRETQMTQDIRLTVCERAVFLVLLRGASNKEIATELGCSVKTIEFHMSNMLRKTGMSSRLELATHVGPRLPRTQWQENATVLDLGRGVAGSG
jgi:DNA-binding NarL/FixJ family response regulator